MENINVRLENDITEKCNEISNKMGLTPLQIAEMAIKEGLGIIESKNNFKNVNEKVRRLMLS